MVTDVWRIYFLGESFLVTALENSPPLLLNNFVTILQIYIILFPRLLKIHEHFKYWDSLLKT